MDRTTEGYDAEPEEVEAVLHNLCGYHLAEPDPLFRYQVLTREQVLYDALVAAIKRERGRALAELATGRTLKQVAEMANLGSRQRVTRLIAIARAAEEAAAQVQAASLAFEEQLAAAGTVLEDADTGDQLVGVADVPSVDGRAVSSDVPIIPGVGDVTSVFEVGFTVTADADADTDTDAAAAEDIENTENTENTERSVDPGAMLGPTLLMPTLTAVLHPTKEMASPEEDELARWRQRDTGAA